MSFQTSKSSTGVLDLSGQFIPYGPQGEKFDVEQAVADVDELYPDEGDEEQDHDQAKENSRVLDAATRARLQSHVPRYAMTHLVMTFGPGYLRTTSTDIKYVLKRCPNIQDLTFRALGSFIDENELGNVVTTCCPRLGRLCFDAKDIEVPPTLLSTVMTTIPEDQLEELEFMNCVNDWRLKI
ncbi:hypothetical protein BGX23_008725 [Mortierella sp. AD031]|nr:hypothetical protein BGX23_008725 [Mortierella sp. AD031]